MCALKFVPRSIPLGVISATFSLSLLASCSSLPSLQIPFVDNAPAAPVVSGGAPAKWGQQVDLTGGVVITDPAYVIGPEDALDISVWKDETLKSSALVRPDGGISFPLAGDFIVAGKTASQVRDELVKRLEKFIPEPVVTVSVVRVASYRIYVIGRVNKPGDFQVGRNVDVLQALSIAGGMTPFASEDDIRIIRKVDGKTVSIPFEYSRIRKGGDLSQNITLKSGDVLLVP
ncbi:MAG: polysaccharide export protein [Burkholderiaceae bacterium]|nr:polysaccharide export protein [Burkholderiaceae bacterium]